MLSWQSTLRYLSYFFVVFGGISCSQTAKSPNEADLAIINICESNINTTITASELFDSIRCVALETTRECLIATVTKIIINKDGDIYIFDGHTNAVFAFDKTGRYIGKIHRKGRAHNEYIALYDVALTKTNELYLLCNDAQTIKVFDRNFVHKQNIHLDFQVDALEQLDDSLLAFNGSGRNDKFIVYDIKNKHTLYTAFPYSEYNSVRKLQPIVKCEDVVCMQQYECQSSLFEIRKDGIYTRWCVKFDGHNITQDDIIQTDLGVAISPHCMEIGWFAENEKYLHFQMQCESVSENPFFVFYSKDSQSIKSISENTYIDDIMHYPHPPIITQGIGDNCFVGIIEPHLLSNHSLVPGLSNICPEDNPIIAFYYIRDF